MLHPQRFIALAFCLIATLVSVGVVHGLWTDRWSSTDGAQELADLGKLLPLSAGRWNGRATSLSEAQEEVFKLTNSLVRQYVDPLNGTTADVLLSRGRPGPTVMMHLPPECYPSAGYEMLGQPKRFLSQSKDLNTPDEFWVATFKKSTGLYPNTVRVYWSWTGAGRWQAPESPRMTFAPYPVIYKLYVVQSLPNEHTEFEGAPVHDLIKELTTATRSSIFSISP